MPSTTPKQAAFMAAQANEGLPAEKRRIKLESAQEMHRADRAAGRFYTREGKPTPELRGFLDSQPKA